MDLRGTIVFSSGKQGDYDIFSLNLETSEVKQLTTGDYWNDCPKWSPDGEKILFVSNRTGYQQIWMMNADGTLPQQITKEEKWHHTPAWAPDGQRIVCCANYDGNIDIYTMKLDGSDLEQITNYEGTDYTPQFSPEGDKIIFTSKRSGNEDIWVYDCTTKETKQLTTYEGRDFHPTYSPNGQKIAFISGLLSDDGKENLEVYVMNATGEEEVRRVTHNLGSERFVTWSPGGDYLLYAASKFNSHTERLQLFDLDKNKTVKLDFDRKKVESEVGAQVQSTLLFKLLPESILRKTYPEKYFGTERYPDWK